LTAFARVFDRARTLGLRTTAHANKPQDVVDVLDLGLDRIDHAWELQGQLDLQQRLARAGTPVTMALSSCFIMLPGRFPTAASFPFDELRRAGVAVTLNVDDAAMFFTDSAQEYRLAADTYGYDAATLAEIALASLEAAWIDDDREERLAAWRDEAMALVSDPRHPQIGATRS
jgi:adenosine deaminase